MRLFVFLLTGLIASNAIAKGLQAVLSISKARAQLISQGWSPLETFGRDAHGTRWSLQGDAGVMYQAGFIEVEACSGTGLNICSFNYTRAGSCLSLQTQGEFKAGVYEPQVIKRTNTCPAQDELAPKAKGEQ